MTALRRKKNRHEHLDLGKIDLSELILKTRKKIVPDRKGITTMVKSLNPEGITLNLVQKG
jgi:hypothetical protein